LLADRAERRAGASEVAAPSRGHRPVQEGAEPVEVDVVDLVEQLAQLLLGAFARGAVVLVQVERADGVLELETDQSSLQQMRRGDVARLDQREGWPFDNRSCEQLVMTARFEGAVEDELLECLGGARHPCAPIGGRPASRTP
jgi:hypothetical protein